ncbi:hypothetical protein GQ457_10G003340 [Hibiscus cannabinus]
MTGVVNLYSKCRKIEEAYKMFDRMPERDLVSWNTIVSGFAQNGLAKLALGLVVRMQSEGQGPDSIILVSILPFVANMGSVKMGRSVHGYVLRAGFEGLVNVNTALVDMYSKCGYIRIGRLIFDGMRQRTTVSWNRVDLAVHIFEKLRGKTLVSWNAMILGFAQNGPAWNAMIDGYGTHGLGKAAIELFNEMQKGTVKPNDVTFLSVLSACSHAGMVEEGRSYFTSMKRDYGIESALDHCGAMVDLLGRAGRLDEARNFIQKMPIEPGINAYGAMLGACKMGEVAKVRTIMKKKGLQKTPGCSVVELRNEVHSFYSGTTNDLQSKRIFAFLEELGDKKKAAGHELNPRRGRAVKQYTQRGASDRVWSFEYDRRHTYTYQKEPESLW